MIRKVDPTKKIYTGSECLYEYFVWMQFKPKFLQQKLLPLLQKLKEVYLLWYGYYQVLPKVHRHSLGQKIDVLFVESIEAISVASFLSRDEKQPWVRLAIRKIDTLKVLLLVLWETKSFDDKKYIALSLKMEEIGRMLGGWNGQLTKSLEQVREKQNPASYLTGK